MSYRKSSTKGARLGTRMRGDLEEAFNLRGSQKAFLFNSYSLKRQSDVVISGKLRFLHFLHAESDPSIETVNYWPSAPGISANEDIGFHAEVITTGGILKLRAVRSETATDTASQRVNREICLTRYRQFPKLSLGKYRSVEFQVLTEQEMLPGHEMRLWNWHRLLPWYAQARYHSLGQAKRLLHARLQAQGACDVRNLLAMAMKGAEGALLIAAAIEAVARGQCQSDLNDVAFSKNTRFFLKGRE